MFAFRTVTYIYVRGVHIYRGKALCTSICNIFLLSSELKFECDLSGVIIHLYIWTDTEYSE